MTGLKSGSGDDLWGDDSEDEGDEAADDRNGSVHDGDGSADDGDGSADDGTETAAAHDRNDVSEGGSAAAEPSAPAADERASESSSDSETPPPNESLTAESATETRPYIVRRAVQDKSVQFEREERLTFFVHDDVVDGERNLLAQLESSLGRDVPKFDVREAVYRAALRNPEDVLEELLNMGYSADEDS